MQGFDDPGDHVIHEMPDDIGHDLLSSNRKTESAGAAAPFAILRAYFILAIVFRRGLQKDARPSDREGEGGRKARRNRMASGGIR